MQTILSMGFTSAIDIKGVGANMRNAVMQIYHDHVYIEGEIGADEFLEFTATVVGTGKDYTVIMLKDGVIQVSPEKGEAVLITEEGMEYHFTGMCFYLIPEICLN